MNYKIDFYTDGSCSTAIKRGGWGCITVKYNPNDVENVECLYGCASDTTNNRMELQGFLTALTIIQDIANNFKKEDNYTINIYSDSAYIVNCFKDKWYKKWLVNGWKSANRVAIKNKELWKPIIIAYNKIIKNENIVLEIKKVKGHGTNKYNNLADTYANKWREEDENNDSK